MNGRVVRRPSARLDLTSTARYLRRNGSPEQAIRFLRDAEQTFAILAANPAIGTLYLPDDPRFAELRYFPMSRFKAHIIFYRSLADGIEVLHVLHGARDYEGVLTEEFGAD